jgi:hypothetical protein
MMTLIRPRLRKPLGIAAAGTVFAAAWALRGGHAWQLPAAMEVTVLVSAVTTYVRAGHDSDDGALAGSRADERQKMLSLRARALGWNFAMAAAFTGLTIGVAVKATWWWPFLAIFAVAGFGQLLGWSTYTTADEDPADDADTEHQVRSPASR